MDVIEPIQPQVKEEVERNTNSLSTQESPMFTQIQGFFGINNADSGERQMLNEVYETLRSDEETETGMLWKIKMIENRIGLPPIGVKRLVHLHGFLKLQGQLNTLEAQLQDIYGK